MIQQFFKRPPEREFVKKSYFTFWNPKTYYHGTYNTFYFVCRDVPECKNAG